MACCLIFLVGFKSGKIYDRLEMTQDKASREKGAARENKGTFYLVEDVDYGSYKQVQYSRVDENNLIVKFLFNKDLKHLLKFKELKIYNAKGERVY